MRTSLEARQQDIREKQLALEQSAEHVEKLQVILHAKLHDINRVDIDSWHITLQYACLKLGFMLTQIHLWTTGSFARFAAGQWPTAKRLQPIEWESLKTKYNFGRTLEYQRTGNTYFSPYSHTIEIKQLLVVTYVSPRSLQLKAENCQRQLEIKTKEREIRILRVMHT